MECCYRNNTVTNGTTITADGNYCAYRLPCGYCMYSHQYCHLYSSTPQWDTGTINQCGDLK